MGESVPLAGTPFTLNYQSDRSPANQEGLRIPLTDAVLPPNLRGVKLEVTVAGKQSTFDYGATPNLTHTLAWDGTDAYGRAVHTTQSVKVRIGYTYRGVYLSPGRREQIAVAAQTFGHYTFDGAPATADSERLEITLWQEYVARVERWDSRAQGLGGWSLNVHHAYSPLSRTILLGDGTQRHAESLSSIISTTAGTGTSGYTGDDGQAKAARINQPADVALAPDGSLYIADRGNRVVRRVGVSGVITTVAGNGSDSFSGDGLPALQAGIGVVDTVAVALDGSLLIGSANRVRRVGADGVISTVAGNGGTTFSGPGALATATSFSRIFDLAVGSDGSIYIACGFQDQIYRVGTDGRVRVVAGIWDFQGYSGDGGLGSAAQLFLPEGVGVGPEGTVYIVDVANSRIRGVAPDGIITTVVGNGDYGSAGDGGRATVANLARPAAIAVASDGGLYIADDDDFTIRYVGSDGIITTVAGIAGTNGSANHGNGGPATAARLGTVGGMTVGPDGVLYIADSDNDVVRRIAPLFPSFAISDTLVASEDGSELYVFDSSYRHKRTVDALTGALRYQFAYDSAGYLTSVTDGSGNVTAIERTGPDATAIIGPGGHRTDLVVTSTWLESITDPAGGTHSMSYSPQGLLVSFSDPRDNVHDFTYDSTGRLTLDEDPEGGSTTLARTELGDDYTVTATSELGVVSTYRVEKLAAGGVRRTSI
ncbi:MAG TPA: SMP-30/gluconolactonase/LRE family protein, partial [Myxococcota bacterium]|nr:SMP-30/gluconolactonase/LRE family protein [Myxococcota bacterium]